MPLTIVTYHFVRDLRNSRYPAIRGRDLAEFSQQIDYFGRHYEIVDTHDVVGACKGETDLPDNALWLTFDDGYLDHYTNVLPVLFERKMHAAFFPPVNAVVHGELLDVNKVHFIRAAETDASLIIKEMKAFIDANGNQDGMKTFQAYWDEFGIPVRYDTAEIWFIKKVLQYALPEASRKALLDELFQTFVSVDQKAFAGELYASEEQLRMMLQCGMYIGGHGAKHYRFDQLDAGEQEREIIDSLQFLRRLGAPTADWVMCYPYGVSDENARSLLRRHGCAVGVTIAEGIADPVNDDPMLLSRLDTIELPIA